MAVADRETRVSPLTFAGDGLLLLCALGGFTCSFLTLYGDRDLGRYASYQATPLDWCAARWDTFLLLAALLALVSLSAWSLPRFRSAAAGGLTVLTGTAALLNWEIFLHGAGLTVRTVTDIFCRRVSWGWAFQYDPGLTRSEETAAVRLFLLLTLTLLALALGWGVVRARRWWVAAFLTLPPLLPGLLADLYPSWPAFMALCACWCAMLLCDLCKWAAPSGRGKLTLTALGCVFVVLAAVSLAFPREGYSRPQWALDMETELYNTANRLSGYFSRWEGPFKSPVTYVGSAGEADLADAGPLNYTGRTVLRVTTDFPTRLYLRGTSLAVYEDGVWTALPEGAYEDYYLDLLDTGEDTPHPPSPLLFPAFQSLRGEQYAATVENVGTSGACVYVPYFPDDQEWAQLGMLPVEDAYFARLQGQRSFTMTFHDCYPANGAPQAEQAYHNLLRECYLDVPEELREPLAELYHQNGLSARPIHGPAPDGTFRGQDTVLDTGGIYAIPDPIRVAQQVAGILDGLCEYDPQAPAAPSGTDPVLYFLNDSQRGYCMHYASAAALMLRTMGVPARYVSGFTADGQPGQQVNVPDRAAHAWVEVWVNGFGWYPVEVTPAAAFEWYGQGDAEPSPEPSEAPEESEAPEPTPTPEPGATQQPSAEPSAQPSGPEDETNPSLELLANAAKALAGAAGAIALLWLGQWLPKRLRAKRLASPDRNRAALDGYGCLRRMERWGGRVDPRAVELAQKARFSQHTLAGEELDELRGLVDLERERLCLTLGPVARLAFRYFWGMPARPKTGENGENSQENGD